MGCTVKNKDWNRSKKRAETNFSHHVPKKLWTDAGREFYNNEVKALLKKHDITLYSTENDEKCSVVERWNRTIKTKWAKALTNS